MHNNRHIHLFDEHKNLSAASSKRQENKVFEYSILLKYWILDTFAIFDTLADFTQCGNCRIFLSLIFNVKSILESQEVLKLPDFAILRALNFVDLVDFSLKKVQKFLEIKIQHL